MGQEKSRFHPFSARSALLLLLSLILLLHDSRSRIDTGTVAGILQVQTHYPLHPSQVCSVTPYTAVPSALSRSRSLRLRCGRYILPFYTEDYWGQWCFNNPEESHNESHRKKVLSRYKVALSPGGHSGRTLELRGGHSGCAQVICFLVYLYAGIINRAGLKSHAYIPRFL